MTQDPIITDALAAAELWQLRQQVLDAQRVIRLWRTALDGDSDLWNHAPDAIRAMIAYEEKWLKGT